ncbi:MAG: sugar phosphate isomerase/epimerase [Gemmatimonadetes bacterium]|jgi:sugar phosphate isomerase/epimerase|nr:sugar phosphate isomerase/epimerase [Gemmatimonadota bacterium]
MLFKISCCAFSFQGLDLDEKLKLVRNMAFDTVDLSAKQGDELSQQMMIESPESYGKTIREKAAQHGLKLDELFICTILDDGNDIDIATDDAATQERLLSYFQQFCLFGQTAGFESIMLVPLCSDETDPQAAWNNTVRMLRRCTEIAVSHELVFNIEPVDFSLLKTPETACKMAEEVPGLGFTLDYSHYVCAGFSQEEIAKMHKYLRHMHIRQATKGSRQEPIETGTIDFAKITQLLLDDDFAGNLAMEHIDKVESAYRPINSVVRQNVELAARVKYTAEHEQTKRSPKNA